jgi:hypothetical protein
VVLGVKNLNKAIILNFKYLNNFEQTRIEWEEGGFERTLPGLDESKARRG